MQRRHGLIALLALAALALGYFGGRATPPPFNHGATSARREGDDAISTKGKSGVTPTPVRNSAQMNASTRSPLPPPGTPLKQIIVELQTRAAAGDAEAASRLYRDTQRCAEVRSINANVAKVANSMIAVKIDTNSQRDLQTYEQTLAGYEKKLNFARDNATLCTDLSEDEVNAAVVPAALRAAQLGDTAAADCYIGSAMPMAASGLLDHPEWLTDYKQNALSVATSAVEQGDWRMVFELQIAYSGNDRPLLLGQVTGVDLLQSYAYLKLERLGTPIANDTSSLDRSLAATASQLNPVAINNADSWAQDMFQNHFQATPRSSSPTSNAGLCNSGAP